MTHSLLSESKIVSICEDDKGRLWIGAENNHGVFRYDLITESFTHYTSDPQNPKSLYHNSIQYILSDSKGDVWITTAMGVLHRYDEESDSFEQYNLDPSHSGSIIKAKSEPFKSWSNELWATPHMFESTFNPGYLWVSSVSGLFRLDLTTHQLMFYNDEVGSSPRMKSNHPVKCILRWA